MRRSGQSIALRVVTVTVAAGVVALLGATASAGAAGRCGEPAQRPWCDTSLSPDARADLLLGALTGDEKISLLAGDDLMGVAGGAHSHTGTGDGVERLGVPTVFYSDGPVGPRQGAATAMPIPMALAATFDTRMAFRHGATIAGEVRSKGNDVVFAPTVNIMRTPLGGRTFEGYGEDPFLVSGLTAGWVRGAQGEGVIASVKHFAANNQEGYLGPLANASRPGQPLGPPGIEGNRLLVDTVVDERTLREIYLPQFEAAVRGAGAGSIMCSYNKLNGRYACENEHLLEDILRRDWGFEGYVLADYGAAHDTSANLNGGLDFEPWPGFAYSPPAVTAAMVGGAATQANVDLHVRRLLRTLFAFGVFDRPAYADDDGQIDKPAHAGAARRIEESAITLLRNDGLLPLRAANLESIAIIGADAARFKTGGGSGAVTPFSFSTPRDAIARRAGPAVKVVYDDGSDSGRAAGVAGGSDVALVFAGDYQTEGVDRYCLTLECPDYNGDQDALIEQVAAANPNTVVILETGGPVLTPWRSEVAALVEAWYPGQEGGDAIARVLFGDVDPGGRLPVTFPRREADLPTAGDPEKYPGVGETVRYKEGVLVGYRWYDANRIEPAFPFGHGLSYARFHYHGLRIEPTRRSRASHKSWRGRPLARVSVAITNTGKRRGLAVPQLYLGLPSPGGSLPQPPKQLKGFRKLRLKPGTTRRVRFLLRRRDLAYWDVAGERWRLARGCYRVMVGRSSRHLPLRGRLARGASCGKRAEKVR